MDILLNLFMSISACILAKTIQVYKAYQVAFCFVIDAVDDEMIIYFCYACRREQ